jgi:hypothetical protein
MLPLITHAPLCSCDCASGDSDGCGRNCGVDGSSRRSCCSVGLYEPKIAVLALEYRMKAKPSPSRISHAPSSPRLWIRSRAADQKHFAVGGAGRLARSNVSDQSVARVDPAIPKPALLSRQI